jgi:hypothetical protein
MILQIAYPSGIRFVVDGVWRGIVRTAGLPSLMVYDVTGAEGNPVLLLDPRAIVRDEKGERIYRPSHRSLEGAPGLQSWLADNPGWVR